VVAKLQKVSVRNVALPLFAVLLATAGALSAGVRVGPAAAATAHVVPQTEYFLSLGDSLPAGIGANDPMNPTNLDPTHSYIDLTYQHELNLHPGLVLENLACSGEQTSQYLTGVDASSSLGLPCLASPGSQKSAADSFLQQHAGHVAFITLTIGADDVLGSATQAAEDTTLANTTYPNLQTIVADLKAQAPGVPIIGTDYHAPGLAYWGANTDGSTQTLVADECPGDTAPCSGSAAAGLALGGANDLTFALSSAYGAAGALYADIAAPFQSNLPFTDTDSVTGFPVSVQTVCNWTWMCASDPPGTSAWSIHPNDQGQIQLAGALGSYIDANVTYPAPAQQPHVITSAASTTFTVASSGSFTVTATGSPAPTFTESGNLPEGVTFSSSGVLSGTPAVYTDNVWPITITATNGVAPDATQRFTLTVAQAPAGYDLVGRDGGVFVFGTGQGFFGSLPGLGVHVDNVVGIVPTADYHGYFLVGNDGGVFAFGDAPFENSLPGVGVHTDNIVGIVPTKDDKGYFLVGSDGGVFAFGDAPFENSLPGLGIHVNDVVGIVPTGDNNGYWLVAANGTVYNLGDAGAYGSLTGPTSPLVGIAATAGNGGYWLVAANGGVWAYGDATPLGSLPALGVRVSNVIDIVPTFDGKGYWLIGSDGGIFAFGDAPEIGSLPGLGVRVNDVVGAVPTL